MRTLALTGLDRLATLGIVAALLAVGAAPAGAGQRLRLVVRNGSRVDQADAAVTSGVPWPRGALTSTHELRLTDAKGAEVPLQVAVLSRWPDTSLKWTLLDFQATTKAGQSDAPYWLAYGPGTRRKQHLAKALLVEEDKTHVIVSTGTALFKVRKAGFNVLDVVRVSGQSLPLVRGRTTGDGLRLVAAEEMTSTKSPGHATFVQLRAADRVFLGRHRMGAEWFRKRGFAVLDGATGKPLGGVEVVGASLDPEGKQNVVGHGWCEGVLLHLSRVPRRHIEVRYPRAAARPRVFYSSLGPAQVAVETRGPVRTVLRAKGRFQAEDGATLCDYVARLHFYAGKARVRLQLTVVNHEKLPLSQGLETYPLLVSDLSLRVPLGLRGLKRFVFAGARRLDTTHSGELGAERDEAKLVQYAARRGALARYEVTQGNDDIASGTTSAGALGLRDAVQGVVASVRHMWANNPKALRVASDGSVEVGIFPAEAGPCEEFLAGRAKTHDILLAFHGEAPPAMLDLAGAFDSPLTALASTAAPAPAGSPSYRGIWYATSGAIGLHPLGTSVFDALFAGECRQFLEMREPSGSYGMWNYGAHGTSPCRVVPFVVERASEGKVESPSLMGVKDVEGLALRVMSGKARAVGRTDPLVVTGVDAGKGELSFVKSLVPVPQKGARARLYSPHGEFLCHRFDPAYALARQYLRHGDPLVLWAARTVSLHLADIGTFHNIAGGNPAWTGACHDPGLGDRAHHAPGLSLDSSWYAGAWAVFLLTGDRALLDSALENAAFAARHADDAACTPLAAALAVMNLCFAADVAPVAAPQDAPAYQAALETYVERLLEAQRRASHGLHCDRGLAEGLVLEALAMYQAAAPRADQRLEPSMLRAADALIRPDRFWSGHAKVGHLRGRDGALLKPYATADGLVADRARDPETGAHGPMSVLVAPYLAAMAEKTGDTKYIKKARRLERVATLSGLAGAGDFALRYRSGDLFAAAWQRYLEAHPPATDPEIAFQCRLENAADVAMPDIGEGGSVYFRPFVALPDGSRACQAQGPGAPREEGAVLWFPLLGSSNLVHKQGTLEFRICYRKGPGRRESPWVLSGHTQKHGFSLGLKGDGLEFVSRYADRIAVRIIHRGVRIQPGKWHHVAFTWRPVWGIDLFLDGRKIGHSRHDRIGFARRLVFPSYPDDQTNEYLIDDLRIWNKALTTFPAATDTKPPAAITDLRLEPAPDGKMRLTWTAPGGDGKKGRARRYDIRITTQRLGPISWGGYADSREPVAAIHWAEADRITPAPKPQPAGRLEKLLIGPLPRRRRVYIAIKAEDEANASPMSNVVTNAVNHPPVAHLGLPVRQVITGSTVALDARASSDPDYDDLTYAWSNGISGDIGDSPPKKRGLSPSVSPPKKRGLSPSLSPPGKRGLSPSLSPPGKRGLSPSVVFDKPGTHKVTLTVADGKAKATATTRILAGDTVRVNFQPRGLAKTPEGFMPDTGDIYAASRGFGWLPLPPGGTSFHRKQPAALAVELRTGLAFPQGAEWVFDLPNGAYKLAVAVGDPAHLAGRRRIFAEGKELFNTDLAAHDKPLVVADRRIKVADGQLNVHIGVPAASGGARSEQGGEINYIIIERVP